MAVSPSTTKPLEAEKFTVLLKNNAQYRCLFKVQFERVNGELGYYIHLPYFAHAQGLVKKVLLVGTPGTSEHVDLASGGSTTNERIKFTHHPDGEAHFSQDGKVVSRIRTRTTRLRDYSGHLFTVQFWGVDGFRPARDKDQNPPSRHRTSVFFDWADHLPSEEVAARVVAHRYPIRGTAISSLMPPNTDYSRPVEFLKGDGTRDNGILLFPSDPRPDDFFIALSYKSLEGQTALGASSLVFHGGYGMPVTAPTPYSAISALIVFYADRYDEWQSLVERLGTIDFTPEGSDQSIVSGNPSESS